MKTHRKFSSVDISTEPDKSAEMAGFLAVERTDQGFKNVMSYLMEISKSQNCLSQLIHNLLIWRATEVHGSMADSGAKTARGWAFYNGCFDFFEGRCSIPITTIFYSVSFRNFL